MRGFTPPRRAIRSRAAIDIAAPPGRVAAVYRDVQGWGGTFPATIESARVVESGDNWQRIEVRHGQEGSVPNTLTVISATEIGLEESKRRFDAWFLNRFEPAPGGTTRYVITGHVRLKGVLRLLRPFLGGYVRRQTLKRMRDYVLQPLKRAAERG